MQVGEQDLALSEPAVLLGYRLLDLHDHVRARPDLLGGGDDLGAGPHVPLLRDAGAGPGALFNQDLLSRAHELVDALGRRGDPVLVVLDLFGDPDDHAGAPARGSLFREAYPRFATPRASPRSSATQVLASRTRPALAAAAISANGFRTSSTPSSGCP